MATFNPRTFTNNTSGNLNKKYKQQYKQIDLDDLDVEMISPQFLQTKTLKKPLQEYDISLSKTNPQGVHGYSQFRETPTSDNRSAVIFQKEQPKNRKSSASISVIDASSLNIKPAYKAQDSLKATLPQSNSSTLSLPKDSNTILAALMRKGIKPQAAIQPEKALKKQQRKVGPAQNKLKAMMNRNNSPNIEINIPKGASKKRETKFQDDTDEIGEQIMEEYDEYGNESFQKISGAQQSGIRQSIVGQSIIKESIRESIRDSIHESLPSSTGQIKQSIREDIKQSIANSSKSLREQIVEQISKGKQDSIEQEYEEVFEQIEQSNSLSRSRGAFKKSLNKKDFDELSASKSFRMKTNVVKSLKVAEQLSKKEKESFAPVKLDDPMLKEQITKQKVNIKRLQQNMAKFFTRQTQPSIRQQKHKDLYYHFKIELNKLISSQNFQSKLKKLASFLAIPSSAGPSQSKLNDLEDGILKNVMNQIENIRVGRYQIDEVQRIRQQYQQKLKEQMIKQEVTLRAEMNQKLSQKDMQLKKMIAELESRMMSRSFYKGGKDDGAQRAQQYEVESDYSIDSDNVSWKADLWELLPEYEKKKLYDKQSAQVTKFLADIMVNELQEEALDRSLDISFQFPEEYNNIPVNYTITERSNESSYSNYSETKSFAKSKQIKREIEPVKTQGFLSDLPKLNIKKSNYSESSNSSDKFEEIKSEPIRRDDKIKPEIIKILSEYKTLYLRKKQEAIRNLLRVIQTKDPETKKHMLSTISQLSILSERQYKKQHKMYIKAYEEEIFMNLIGIYNKSLNKKRIALEQQMKKMYDRLVVVCQVTMAEKCTERVALDAEKNMKYNVEVLTKEAISMMEQHPCFLETLTNENYMELKTKTEEKQVKNDVVQHIVNILTTEFAKEFPKKKK